MESGVWVRTMTTIRSAIPMQSTVQKASIPVGVLAYRYWYFSRSSGVRYLYFFILIA